MKKSINGYIGLDLRGDFEQYPGDRWSCIQEQENKVIIKRDKKQRKMSDNYYDFMKRESEKHGVDFDSLKGKIIIDC